MMRQLGNFEELSPEEISNPNQTFNSANSQDDCRSLDPTGLFKILLMSGELVDKHGKGATKLYMKQGQPELPFDCIFFTSHHESTLFALTYLIEASALSENYFDINKRLELKLFEREEHF